MPKALPAILLAGALTLFAVAAFGADPLDLGQDDILAYVKGKSVDAKHTDHGGTFNLDFRADGTLYGTVEGRRDSGTWSVRDGQLCIKWRRWIYDGCGKVQKLAPNQIQHLWPDGRVHFTAPG